MRIRTLTAGLAAAFAFIAPASAQDCGANSADTVKLLDWSAKPDDYGVAVKMKLENISGKGFRMVKGGVRFYDPFGENIASLAIGPDITVKAGETFNQNGSYFAARLAKVNPVDITAIACVEGVVYTDGTKAEFK